MNFGKTSVITIATLLVIQSASGAFLNGIFPESLSENDETGLPLRLSETGAFSNLANLTPSPDLIAYSVNTPLWSDHALKRRWISIPGGSKIQFEADDPWTFPEGTVAIKHFELQTGTNTVRRLETRFIVRTASDLYGVTYRWRLDGSDADLVSSEGTSDQITGTRDGLTFQQTWTYPSRTDCKSCHNGSSGTFLGVRTHQLNRLHNIVNQLDDWNNRNLFTESIGASFTYQAMSSIEDTSATLEDRVRSYLGSNCAHCHNPGNDILNTGFDLRHELPLSATQMIYGELLYPLGIDGAGVIVPDDIVKSIAHTRMDTNDTAVRMPPLGRTVIDEDAVQILRDWISQLDTNAGSATITAVKDNAESIDGATIAIDVAQNDTIQTGVDFESRALPEHGNLSWNGGIATYTPDSGYLGEDSFRYRMTLGNEISNEVKVAILVRASTAASDVSFTEASNRLGDSSDYGGVGNGAVDMNQDGRDDIVHFRDRKVLSIDYQQASGSFVKKTINTSQSVWGVAIGDTDNNGFPDLVFGGNYDGLTYLQAKSTLSGNAGSSAYQKSVITDPGIFLQAVSFADMDNDGWLDLLPCHDEGLCPPFRNNGDGDLTYDPGLIDTSTTPVSDNSGNYGIVWTDYDNDGDLDMYLSKCRGGVTSPTSPLRINQLFRNNSNNGFTEVAAGAGLAVGSQSWVADFGDIDNDGDLDCFIGNHSDPSRLMMNNGDGTFTDISAASGIAVNFNVIQTIFRDFNCDGWVDLFLTGARHQLWMNTGGGAFALANNPFTTLDIHTAVVGDLNTDGRPDLYVGYGGGYNGSNAAWPNRLFLSDANGNNTLSVRLEGVQSNRLGVGARIELHGPWGIQVREVRAGEGYGITHSFTHNFGLGTENSAPKLVVRWPSGQIDTFENVAANQFLDIQEGSGGGTTVDPGTGNNLITNGSFEDGLSSWDTWQTVHLVNSSTDGSKGARLGDSLLLQTVSVVAGKKYKVSGFAKSTAQPDWISLDLNFFDAGGNYLSGETVQIEESANFSPFELIATAPFDSKDMVVGIYCGTGGNLIVDQIIAEEDSPEAPVDPVDPPVEGSDLLTNGAFENGLTGWDTWQTVTVVSNAAQLSESLLIQNTEVSGGSNYRLNGKYRTTGSPGWIEAGVTYYNAAGSELETKTAVLDTAGSYTTFSFDSEAPAAATLGAVWFWGGAGGNTLVDDIEWKLLSSGGGNNNGPGVILSTPNPQVTGPFSVEAAFSSNVTGLTISDFSVTNGTVGGLSNLGADTYFVIVNPTAPGTVTVKLPAAAASGNQASNTLSVAYNLEPVDPAPPAGLNLTVNSTAAAQSFSFGDTYASPVVLTTVHRKANQPPMVVRLRNITSEGGEIKVERIDGLSSPVNNVDIELFIVEEGVYTNAVDGINMEVGIIELSETSGTWNGWDKGTQIPLVHNYTNPVVIGQIQTSNSAK